MSERRWKFLLDGQEPEVFDVGPERNLAAEFVAFCAEHPDGGQFLVQPDTMLDIGCVVGIIPLVADAEKKKSPRVQRLTVLGFQGTSVGPV